MRRGLFCGRLKSSFRNKVVSKGDLEVICYLKAERDFCERDCLALARTVKKLGNRVIVCKGEQCAQAEDAALTNRLAITAGDEVKLVGAAPTTRAAKKEMLLFENLLKA